MNTISMTKEYLIRDRRYFQEAERSLTDRDYPSVIRRSQEALELATKALLRFFSIEYPREHDVSDALAVLKEKLPTELKEKLPDWKKLLRNLARQRGPSFYGYERENIPASQIFTYKTGSRPDFGFEISVIGICL